MARFLCNGSDLWGSRQWHLLGEIVEPGTCPAGRHALSSRLLENVLEPCHSEPRPCVIPSKARNLALPGANGNLALKSGHVEIPRRPSAEFILSPFALLRAVHKRRANGLRAGSAAPRNARSRGFFNNLLGLSGADHSHPDPGVFRLSLSGACRETNCVHRLQGRRQGPRLARHRRQCPGEGPGR